MGDRRARELTFAASLRLALRRQTTPPNSLRFDEHVVVREEVLAVRERIPSKVRFDVVEHTLVQTVDDTDLRRIAYDTGTFLAEQAESGAVFVTGADGEALHFLDHDEHKVFESMKYGDPLAESLPATVQIGHPLTVPGPALRRFLTVETGDADDARIELLGREAADAVFAITTVWQMRLATAPFRVQLRGTVRVATETSRMTSIDLEGPAECVDPDRGPQGTVGQGHVRLSVRFPT